MQEPITTEYFPNLFPVGEYIIAPTVIKSDPNSIDSINSKM